MTYDEVIHFLYNSLPVFHREGKKAYKPGLDNIASLCAQLNNPHHAFKSLHIAGTNGKGSSSHFIASILQEHGFKVGLYTSPHLKSFTERIKINGKEVSKEWVTSFVSDKKNIIQEVSPSFFEWTVAMAFCYFKEQQVDWAIIETGLGGRLDSTNIIMPLGCLITNIGYDHQDILGNSLGEIANEKAGIIKLGTPVTISEFQPEISGIFIDKAKENQAVIQFAKEENTLIKVSRGHTLDIEVESKHFGKFKIASPYVGTYQIHNILGVLAWSGQLASMGIIDLKKDIIELGIKNCRINTQLKGRFEMISNDPKVIADTAHNESGIRLLMDQINSELIGDLWIILGMVADKDLDLVLQILPKNADYIFCESHNPRSLKASNLLSIAQKNGLMGTAIKDVNEAIAFVKNKMKQDDLILVTGSTYLIAEIDEIS
jgi:dihydrofolate synthase / folylpolyglutamate synthase